jgi:hypothetical protein
MIYKFTWGELMRGLYFAITIGLLFFMTLVAGHAAFGLDATTLASGQNSTGASASTCDVSNSGVKGWAIEMVTTGTISVDATNTSWITLAGTGLPNTSAGTNLYRFNAHPQCQDVRTNIGSCSTCTLTAYCK